MHKQGFPLLTFVLGSILLAQGCNFNFSSGGALRITDDEAQALLIKTLQSFQRSVNKGDFEEFHQTEVATSARNELTAKKFNAAFAEFIRNRVDIRPTRDARINWSPKPGIDGKHLNLSGNYPAESGKTINFKLQYLKDSVDWDVKFINIKIS